MEVAASRNFYCASSALVLMLISFQCPLTKTVCLASFFAKKKKNMLGKIICYKRKFLCPGTFSVSVGPPLGCFFKASISTKEMGNWGFLIKKV
jgi:hypothetical protein